MVGPRGTSGRGGGLRGEGAQERGGGKSRWMERRGRGDWSRNGRWASWLEKHWDEGTW